MRKLAVSIVALLALTPVASAGPRDRAIKQTDETLKDAAIAQEEYSVSHGGDYTDFVRDLRREGLRYDRDKIDLFVSWADDAAYAAYCLQARHELLQAWRYYSSEEGAPRKGRCPDTARARRDWRDRLGSLLMHAATAQESYRVSNNTYATSLDQLRGEGWRNPYRETRLAIVRADDSGYCMEAMHRRLDTPSSFDSADAEVRHGTSCPG